MVVCKFFLQGNCKFGDYCKNEHQIQNEFNRGQQHFSILRQPHFNGNQFQNVPNAKETKPNVDVNTIVKAVVDDMVAAEKGSQWPLSCYGPYRDKPTFPGFEEHSFEEMRLGYYTARQNGTLEQYKQQVNVLLQQALYKMKTLQNPSMEIVEILKTIYNAPTSQQTTMSHSPFTQGFNSNPQASMFPSQGLLKTPESSGGNIFAGGATSANVFNPQANKTMFNNPQNSNIFAQGNAAMFPSNTGSIFSNQNTSIFAQQPIQQMQNPGNTFATQAMVQQMPVQQMPFQQQPEIKPVQQMPFQQQQQPEIKPSTNIFANQQGMQMSGNIFGNQNQGNFGFSNQAQENFYSKREDLTEDEIKWFESDDMDVLKIPEKPPTRQMCFS